MPLMGEDDFNRLVKDIDENGQIEPIWMYEGQILDGRHRYMACVELGIEPELRQYEQHDPVSFVLSLNLNRRHLDATQRAMIAASIAMLTKGNATGANQHQGGNASIEAFPTQAQAAEKLNVSRSSVQRARKVLENESEETIEAAKAGKISLGSITKKPKLQVVKDEEPEYDEDAYRIKELGNQLIRLDDENAQLRDAISCGKLPEQEVQEAGDTIKELRAQIKTLEAELDAVKSSRDSYLRENEELKKQCRAQRNQLRKVAG